MVTTNAKRGFTLIEILVVIGIIAILAAIVIIAINPARQFAQARNSQRVSNVETILNAVGQRLADNKGIWSAVTGCEALPTSAAPIGSADLDISCLVPTYISTSIPVDPSTGSWTSATNYDSDYTIVASSTGRITVCAPEYDEDALGNPGSYCLTR